jgi:YcxB-like protein
MTRRIYRQMVLSQLGKRVWVYRVTGGVIAVCMGVVQAIRWDFTGAMTLLVGLFIAFLHEVIAAIGWWRTRSIPDRHFSYAMTDDSIEIHTQASDVSLRWNAVVKVRTTPHAWQVRTRVGACVIPRAAFTEVDQAEIDRFIAAGSFPRPTGVASS